MKYRNEIIDKLLSQSDNAIKELNKEFRESRGIRRIKIRYNEKLHHLVHKFLEERGKLNDLFGEESSLLFDKYNNIWKNLCGNFNRRGRKITLRYEAFTDKVNYYLELEEEEIKRYKQNHFDKEYLKWVANSSKLLLLWLKIKSLFGSKSYEYLSKEYFKDHYYEPINID